MDYKITQSQLNKMISKYMELKNYEVIEFQHELHLVDGDGEYKITLTFGGDCIISVNLIYTIKSIFGIKDYISVRNSIVTWVENKFNIPVQYPSVM